MFLFLFVMPQQVLVTISQTNPLKLRVLSVETHLYAERIGNSNETYISSDIVLTQNFTPAV